MSAINWLLGSILRSNQEDPGDPVKATVIDQQLGGTGALRVDFADATYLVTIDSMPPNPLPEQTKCQRIVKAALGQAMKEGVVGGMIEVVKDNIPDAIVMITRNLMAEDTKRMVVLIIPDDGEVG